MAGKKETAGRRIPVSWGTVTKKVGGKATKVPAISMVGENVVTACGLKPYKFGNRLKTVKDKKGRTRVAGQGITYSATRYLLVHIKDDVTPKGTPRWRRVPIPQGISLANASKQLQGGKKVAKVRLPSGLARNAVKLADSAIVSKKTGQGRR